MNDTLPKRERRDPRCCDLARRTLAYVRANVRTVGSAKGRNAFDMIAQDPEEIWNIKRAAPLPEQ